MTAAPPDPPASGPGGRHSADRFRPDLEGLRAVAVILVLLYHAGVTGFGGGYVGVDVFFVLSGFLITGLIYRELASTGRFSLSNFYARRARRLLPAAGFVLIVTLIAALLILPSFRLPSVGTDIASAGLYVSNMRFGFEANDYFQATADPSPVLHFWSLSVEEQFYIVWPTILVALFAGARGVASGERRLLAGIGVIGLLSLIGAIVLTGINQPWAFFLLPTRAWELAIGGLIAVGIRRLSAIPRPLAASATVVGVACVVVAALVLNDDTPFPGLAAILPVAGAALVIVGGLPDATPMPARLLARGPLRFLGRISYSLYLWHWPILLFGAILLGPTMAIPLAILAIPVAAASQRWIEEPLRYGRFIGIRPSRNLLQAAGVGVAVVIASAAINAVPQAVTIAAAGGVTTPGPDSTGALSPSQTATGPQPCSDCTVADLTPPLADLLAGRISDGGCKVKDPTECVLGSSSANAPVIALFGDSHAGNWTSVLLQLATAHGWRFVHLTHGGCESIDTPIWSLTLKRAFTECDEWREAAMKRLEQERPDLIIIANSAHPNLVDAGGSRVPYRNPPSEVWTTLWSAGVDRTLGRLTAIGSAVAILGDGPVPGWSSLDPAVCIAQRPTTFGTCQADVSKVIQPVVRDVEKSMAAAHGVTYADPTGWFCGGLTCPAVIDKYIVYADDSGHLTTPFALSLADRLLAAMPFP
jgi:peptidoglycan/LPS O-acetylase OafA/YrhL